MKNLLLIMLAISFTRCSALVKASDDNRDHLIGFFKLPVRDLKTRKIKPGPGTLIPIFKIKDKYYTATVRGPEISLSICPEGLEYSNPGSSFHGTTIGYEKKSGKVYIKIIDNGRAAMMDPHYIKAEKQPMERIDKPFWILDDTAPPPQVNDDFLGLYQAVWSPYIRYEIKKEGDKYFSEIQIAGESGGDKGSLIPKPDGLGFVNNKSPSTCELGYNENLKRFEFTFTIKDYGIVRTPLVRIKPSTEDKPALPPGTGIGFMRFD